MLTRRDADGNWGASAMIPGSFELRPRTRAKEPDYTAGRLKPHSLPADPGDRERLEREREDGLAPHAGYVHHSGATDFMMRALLRLTERFIRLMRTTPSTP